MTSPDQPLPTGPVVSNQPQEKPPQTRGDRTHGVPGGSNELNLNVNAQNLNLQLSNIDALSRLQPSVARQLIAAAEKESANETHKYTVAAASTALIVVVMLLAAAAIIIAKGLLEGVVFFCVCAAASAIVTAVFTGKAQSLDWTVRVLPFGKEDGNPRSSEDTGSA